MIDSRASSERPGGRRFWRHAGGLGVIGVIIALALGAAFMSIGHDQRPRELPIAAVGTPATAQTVEAQAPGELSVRAVRDRAAARQEIAERDVYGAVVLGEQGVRELLIASAANNGVANFLRRTLGRATPDGVLRITDVRPLPEDDATGSTSRCSCRSFSSVGASPWSASGAFCRASRATRAGASCR